MRSSEKEKLLDDLLGDANYEAFRREVYELSAAEFRAKRQTRARHIYFALAASIVVLGTILSISLRTKTSAPDSAAANSADANVASSKISPPVVSSAQAAESSAKIATAFQKDRPPTFAFIATAALEPVELIRSLPDIRLMVSTPSGPARGIEMVYSDSATVDPVTDAQLLALFPHETVGFFQTPHGKKLVVIGDPEVSFRFPVAPPLIHGAIP